MEVEMVAVGMEAETVVAMEGGMEEGATEGESLAVVSMAEVATVRMASEVENPVVEARAEGD